MFTTFLFEKLSHLRQFYGTEQEFITHLLSGEVTVPIPDLLNYVDGYCVANKKLPSLWQNGDSVSLTFPGNGLLKKCRVIKVAFTSHSEPLYDVEIPYNYFNGEIPGDGIPETPNTGYARIHGLKEWHLRNPEMPVADRVPLPQNKIN